MAFFYKLIIKGIKPNSIIGGCLDTPFFITVTQAYLAPHYCTIIYRIINLYEFTLLMNESQLPVDNIINRIYNSVL